MTKSKHIMAAFLAVIMMLSAIAPMTASAAEVTMDLSKAEVSWDYTLTDAEGNAFVAAYGLNASDNPFGTTINPTAKKMHDYTAKRPGLTGSKSDWVYGQDYVYCFCIEHGVALPNSDSYSGSSELTHGNKYEMLSENQKNLISLALAYGYPNRTDLEDSADANACYSATQLIIWQISLGFRSSPTELNDRTYPADGYTGTMTEQYTSNKYLKDYYDRILSDMATHYYRPSFTSNVAASAPSYEMEYANGRYSITLTDTNNVLSNFYVSSSGGVSTSISGNTLTISSSSPLTSEVTVKLTKRMPRTTHTTGFLIWSVPGKEEANQDMISGVPANNDPVPAYLKLMTAAGSAKIIKTSEDGNVSGISFTISGNGVNQTVKTGSNGQITIDNLRPGTYTVTEQSISYYEPQQSKTITVVSGETASVSFNNILKRSDLKVIKTSEDNLNEGVKFHLYGKSSSGKTIDLYATTDANGVALFTDVLVGTNYTLEEVDTAERYIVPDSQIAVIEWNKVTENDFYNELKRGDLKVVKTSEDNMVEGIKFHLYGTSLSGDTVDEYAVTDKNGVALFENILIGSNYTIEEVDTAERYIVPETQTAAIEWNKVTEKSFENILKRGDLKVIKTAEDNLAEGLRFHLYGTSLSGIKVDEYATTDANGVACFEDILIGSGYTIEEVNTPIRYVVPEAQSVAIEWNKVTEQSFNNVLKKWRAEVNKKDIENERAQGDATLEGAVYGVYRNGVLLDTYTTDANGYFLTDYYSCTLDGEQAEFYIQEITPSEGYLLDTTKYYIDCSAENYTVELNTEYLEVYETVIKGNISIIKHTDDGSTQIETPEEGAAFEIFLKAAGSYDNAKDTERDVIVCDKYGFGQTKAMPYGVYTVHQVSGWDGRELMDDFDVFISQDGQTYRYLINNRNFESYVRVVKIDAESGKTIPYAGAGFKIYDPSGNLVTMTYTYPTLTTIDTFYTDANGSLITPEKLEYGKGYSLVEVQAPYGYVLDETPVMFDVVEENSTDESGVTVIKVDKANVAQKGTITIEKMGEVFFGVSVIGGVDENGTELPTIYQPIYDDMPLAGAVFEIRAAEDIYTPDGTLRYEKGEIVDTVTTGSDGYAKSKELYLGKYEVKEIKAPHGMIINNEIHSVELTYAGQNVAVTETATSVYNERQKATLSMQKVLETNDLFGIGNNGEIKNVVFGLYAAEEIVSVSGTSIPADGLIEIITFDEFGVATIQSDLPMGSYYVKEIATDEHYILNSDKYAFAFEYAGEQIVSVELTVNGGEPIENDLIYGSVSGMKVDENGEALSGAIIGLFKQDETVFTIDTALMTTTSAEDGSFSFEKIPYGHWVVREIEQPVGFILNETVFDVIVKENAQVIDIEIVNEFIRGNITLTKVDADYPDNKLTGATFEVYADTNDNGELDAEDTLIGTLEETELGIYSMNELLYGRYFVKETAAPEGFLLDSNVYTVFIDTDEMICSVENKAGVGFINDSMKGSLKIVKTSSDGNVQGFTFRVTGTNGYDETFVTDENGEIIIEGLRIGEYTVSEVANDASANYVRPADKKAAVMTDSTTIVEMHNVYMDNPKTGDNSNIGLWLALAGASAIGIVVTVILGTKKRKKEDAE